MSVHSQTWYRPNRVEASPPLRDDSMDADVVTGLRAHDPAALDLALQRYWFSVVAYVGRLVETSDAAGDIAQRTFCLLWERRSTWRADGSVRGLLYRIARNFALSERRHRSVELRFAADRAEPDAPNPTPLDIVENDQLRVALEGAIAQLPPRRREVFVLRCVHNLSYKEIAEVMRISPQTVANQLSHAIAALRQSLETLIDD
jgi:RNA polymerase sigma-70 factor, ECF subfamily